MKVGFTGTRKGWTDAQAQTFYKVLVSLAPTEFHHGDCVGADDSAATAVAFNFECCTIHCHPPLEAGQRALNSYADVTKPPLLYHTRNRAIVVATDLLIACPAEMDHQSRGGTWYTVDYARKQGKEVIVCWPDGTTT